MESLNVLAVFRQPATDSVRASTCLKEDYQIIETDFFQKCDQEVELLDGGYGLQRMLYSLCR